MARRIHRAWWARFTFNGITRCERGTYDLVGGEELSDAGTWPKASVAEPLREELLQLCRQRVRETGFSES